MTAATNESYIWRRNDTIGKGGFIQGNFSDDRNEHEREMRFEGKGDSPHLADATMQHQRREHFW